MPIEIVVFVIYNFLPKLDKYYYKTCIIVKLILGTIQICNDSFSANFVLNLWAHDHMKYFYIAVLQLLPPSSGWPVS